MYSVHWVLDRIKIEKSKEDKDAFFLSINAVLELCGKVLFCSERKKLVDGIHKATCDEDLITFYFALPIVAASAKMDYDDYSGYKTLIEAKIPEINSLQSPKAKERLDRLIQLKPEQLRFMTEKDLYSLEADVIVTKLAVEFKVIKHDTKNSEYFWWLRERLCANRRFNNLHSKTFGKDWNPND